jgi:transcription-repair coupling factor (superfamily II helicase)
VLTLTATPIPRTLHMSLVGLRDISVIQTPPRDRLSIQTVVAPRTDQIIRNAIEQEIGRAGQVYFIHNRVESIWQVAAHIQQLVPGARIGVGHGQLAEKDIEKVVLKFMRHEFDVFVCTTIVENGLDIPLANTIVIDKAENYGLSELYQLRGRVGRSNRRAYAYLLVEEGKELSSTARKRLAALKEFSELGSGFKIAALDLELRGAGNLLGAEQHGHIAAVGFETYCRLLEDTMRKLQGEDVEEAVRSSLKLQLDVHIPPDYIGDEIQRLQVYKRLAEIRTDADAERIRGELRDRYGTAPAAVSNLIEYALLKSRAEQLRIESIERRRTQWTLRFREDSKVDAKRLMQFVAATRGASFSPQGVLQCELNGLESPLNTLKKLLDELAPAGLSQA